MSASVWQEQSIPAYQKKSTLRCVVNAAYTVAIKLLILLYQQPKQEKPIGYQCS